MFSRKIQSSRGIDESVSSVGNAERISRARNHARKIASKFPTVIANELQHI